MLWFWGNMHNVRFFLVEPTPLGKRAFASRSNRSLMLGDHRAGAEKKFTLLDGEIDRCKILKSFGDVSQIRAIPHPEGIEFPLIRGIKFYVPT